MSNDLLRKMTMEGDTVDMLEASTPQAIVMRGPLAMIFEKAIDIMYAKDDPVTGEPAANTPDLISVNSPEVMTGSPAKIGMESQAQDAQFLQNAADQVANMDDAPEPYLTVYGTTQSEVTEASVVDLTQAISEAEDSSRVILIMDGTQPGPNSEAASVPVIRVEDVASDALEHNTPPEVPFTQTASNPETDRLIATMECLVLAHGGKVYPSLESWKAENVGVRYKRKG